MVATSVDLDGGKRVMTFDELGGTIASGGIPGITPPGGVLDRPLRVPLWVIHTF